VIIYIGDATFEEKLKPTAFLVCLAMAHRQDGQCALGDASGYLTITKITKVHGWADVGSLSLGFCWLLVDNLGYWGLVV